MRPGPALYISCEDDRDEVHFRLERIKAAEPDFDLTNLHAISFAEDDKGAVLALPDVKNRGLLVATDRFALIEYAAQACRAELLVLDSSADLFGGDEIDRVQRVEECESAEGFGDIEMIRTQRLFAQCEGAFGERLGFAVSLLVALQLGERPSGPRCPRRRRTALLPIPSSATVIAC